jgi:hypothetical protein
VVAFGAPMMMALFVFYLGMAAIIPLVSGLLGFSRRVPYLMTATLTCGLIYLEAVTFSDALKFQDVYRLVLIKAGVTVLGMVELLITFILAHWLGARFRAGIIWVKDRLS